MLSHLKLTYLFCSKLMSLLLRATPCLMSTNYKKNGHVTVSKVVQKTSCIVLEKGGCEAASGSAPCYKKRLTCLPFICNCEKIGRNRCVDDLSIYRGVYCFASSTSQVTLLQGLHFHIQEVSVLLRTVLCRSGGMKLSLFDFLLFLLL